MKITVIVETDSGRYSKTVREAPDPNEASMGQAVVNLGTRTVWGAAENYGSYDAYVPPMSLPIYSRAAPICIDGCDSLDCHKCSPETAGLP